MKSRRCVGGWAQDAATLVTVAQGQTARSLGLSHGGGVPWAPVWRAACWAFVYIPGLGCLVPRGGKSEAVFWWERQLRIGCEHSLSHQVCPEQRATYRIPTPRCSFSPILNVLFCSVLLSDVGAFFCLFRSPRRLVSFILNTKPVSPSISLGAPGSLRCEQFCLTLSRVSITLCL